MVLNGDFLFYDNDDNYDDDNDDDDNGNSEENNNKENHDKENNNQYNRNIENHYKKQPRQPWQWQGNKKIYIFVYDLFKTNYFSNHPHTLRGWEVSHMHF